ncbi:MAG: helix-turn-helix domain-containing protein [Myxococcota bacterium]
MDAILAAGEDLMERRGLDEVTTEEIAARAGVSIGTLYQYYPPGIHPSPSGAPRIPRLRHRRSGSSFRQSQCRTRRRPGGRR